MYPGGASFHEELLKRRKANTYKERRKEGRTVHTKASKTAITVASIALVFNAMAIAMPHWRTSWVALIGYGGRRHWGLLAVQGRKMQFHHTMFEDNCNWTSNISGKWYGHLLLGNACLSPICKWYLLKCNTYFDFCIYSYSAAFVIVLGFIVHVLCLIWTCFLTGRSLRWASTWWPVAAMLHLGGSVFWIIVTEGIFDQLDEESWYPIPTPGAAFFLACVGGLGQLVCVWLGFSLKSMWPEVDPDDPSQFITDSEKSEDEDDVAAYEEAMPEMTKAPMPGPAMPATMPELPQGGAATYSAGSPAAESTPEKPQRQWYYQDNNGDEQGPFPESMMIGWHSQGSFTSDLLIRREDETDFAPLGDGIRLRS